MNPYLPPQAPEPSQAPQVPQQGGPQLHWEIGEVINQAWATFKPNWGPLVGAMFVGQLIGSIPRVLLNVPIQTGQIAPGDDEYLPIILAGTVIGIIAQTFFQAGWMKMWLCAARGQPVVFGDLFSGLKKFFPMLGVILLNGLAVLGGSILFCVPGVILGLGFMLAGWFVVDQNLGVIDAMKASWRVTTGQKGKLFGFVLMSMLIIFVGYCACCIGVLASFPVAMIASAIVYLRLTGQPAFDPTAPAAYYPPPGGYGGPPGPGGYGPPPAGGFGGM